MRPRNVIRPGLAGGTAAVLIAGSVGLVFDARGAAAAGRPICTDPSLTSSGPTNNGDGTTSLVVKASTVSATATVSIPANVRSARIDACGAQGSDAAGAAGGR